MSKLESALSFLKIHITAAHPEKNKISDAKKSGDKIVEADSDDEATCPLCFKIFHNKFNMKRHRKMQHDGSMRLKCCDYEKTFASKTALQYHKKKRTMRRTLK